MTQHIKGFCVLIAYLFVQPVLVAQNQSAEGTDVAAAAPDFARDIRPLLKAHCIKCHGEEKQQGGLRLDLKAAALKGARPMAAGRRIYRKPSRIAHCSISTIATSFRRWNFAGRSRKQICHRTRPSAASVGHRGCWSSRRFWIAWRGDSACLRKSCASGIFTMGQMRRIPRTTASSSRTIASKPSGRS